MKNIYEIEDELKEQFKRIDEIAFVNQKRVLEAFKQANVCTNHFAGTTGYGYSDIGKEKLCEVFANFFGTDTAIVSPLLTCATHAITVALMGLLRPHDVMFSITGKPYDTLDDVIFKENNGGFKDFLIEYKEANIFKQDFSEIEKQLLEVKPKVIFIQRSRGYNWSSGLSCEQILKLTQKLKKLLPNSYIFLDNCYGEMTYDYEPTKYIDVCVGSLIKNAGGGIAQTGAYIAGTYDAIDKISTRFTSPALKTETGSYEMGYRIFFEGFFLAPQVVKNALKGAMLIGEVLNQKGYEVLPKSNEKPNDVVKSILFNSPEKLIAFVQLIQKNSPVDSTFLPQPSDMQGYDDKIIMASGSFVSGSSIELSCDAPIKPPYIAYFQGGLTYEHCKIVAEKILDSFL